MERKKCILFLLLLTIGSIITVACDNKEISSGNIESIEENIFKSDENYIKQTVTDNMIIDAAIKNGDISECYIYEVTGKEFQMEQLMQYFWKDTIGLSIEKNEKSGVSWVEGTDGSELTVGSGSITYSAIQGISEVTDIIKFAYEQELSDTSKEQIQSFYENNVVSNAAKFIEELYNPADYEEISLIKGVKIDMETILQIQEQWKEEGEVSAITSDMLGNEAYYLFFGVSYQGIPMANSDEYTFGKMYEDAITSYESIEVIADENGICYLYMDGLFEVKGKELKSILSIQKGMQKLKEKYELVIIPKEQIIGNIYLEYIFVHDEKSKDYNKGKLVPYWCFVNNTSEYADRFSAITGEDFQYE